jgi:hypothetical protein
MLSPEQSRYSLYVSYRQKAQTSPEITDLENQLEILKVRLIHLRFVFIVVHTYA